MVEWCNQNAGFVTAIGVIATVLGTIATSMVAVLVARWPYRAALECNPFLDADPQDAQKDDSYTCPLHLYLHNSGNIPLEIKEITVTNEMRTVCGHYYGNWNELIKPMDSRKFVFKVHVPEVRFAKKMWVKVKTQKKTFIFLITACSL